jgi:hypothetical protein
VANAVWTDRLAAPLDGLRERTLLAVLRARAFRWLLGSRERRIAFVMSAHACVALLLTVLLPIPLFVAVPLVLGVPHVVNDLRYLVLRRVSDARVRALVLSGSTALIAVSAAGLSGVRFDVARAEVLLGMVAISLAAASPLIVRRGRLGSLTAGRGAFALSAIAAIGAVALSSPRTALVVILHGHNVVAIVAWLWLFRARPRTAVLPLSLIFGGSALLVAGTMIPLTMRLGVWDALGTNLLVASDVIAPGLPAALGVGLTLAFVFLQSVHYLVWLVLVPTDAEGGSGASSFRRSLRSLFHDLGTVGIVSAVALFVVFAGLGVAAPMPTRHAYLALAGFHVWLELAVLAFHFVNSGLRRPRFDAARVHE